MKIIIKIKEINRLLMLRYIYSNKKKTFQTTKINNNSLNKEHLKKNILSFNQEKIKETYVNFFNHKVIIIE